MKYVPLFEEFVLNEGFPSDATKLEKALAKFKKEKGTMDLEKFRLKVQKAFGGWVEAGTRDKSNEVVFGTNSGWTMIVGVTDVSKTGDITLPVTYSDFKSND